jgi:hypothetical protein
LEDIFKHTFDSTISCLEVYPVGTLTKRHPSVSQRMSNYSIRAAKFLNLSFNKELICNKCRNIIGHGSHTKGRPCNKRNREREGNLKLECG